MVHHFCSLLCIIWCLLCIIMCHRFIIFIYYELSMICLLCIMYCFFNQQCITYLLSLIYYAVSLRYLFFYLLSIIDSLRWQAGRISCLQEASVIPAVVVGGSTLCGAARDDASLLPGATFATISWCTICFVSPFFTN